VYFDQLTSDRGKSLLCHDAYHDEATWDPHLFEDLLARPPKRVEWERLFWVSEWLEGLALLS
jgi:hypothetical protein